MKLKIILILDNIKFKVINLLHNLIYNQFNKEKILNQIGYKKMIKLLKEIQLQENLFIKKEIELKMLVFLVIFIILKKLLNLLLIEKNQKFDFNNQILLKEIYNLLLKILNILNLKVFKEVLYLIIFKMKFQLVFLNLLFMMFLFININMNLLKNLVNHVVVMIIIRVNWVMLILL